MRLGNFFDAVGAAQPINPKPVKFKVVCKNDVLPNGTANPTRRPVGCEVTAAFVFLAGDEAIKTRSAARKLLADLLKPDGDEPPVATDEWDLEFALRYVQLSRVLFEYDEQTREIGQLFFPDALTTSQLVGIEEANRLMLAYKDYVKEEHPTEVTAKDRDKSQVRGARVAGATRR